MTARKKQCRRILDHASKAGKIAARKPTIADSTKKYAAKIHRSRRHDICMCMSYAKNNTIIIVRLMHTQWTAILKDLRKSYKYYSYPYTRKAEKYIMKGIPRKNTRYGEDKTEETYDCPKQDQ